MTNRGQEIMWNAYLAYLKGWVNDHKGVDNFGMSPVCFDEWQDNEGASEEYGCLDVDIGMED